MNGSERKTILIINGSASNPSTNGRLIEIVASQLNNNFKINVFDSLKMLPHFDPKLSSDNPPQSIVQFRNSIERAAGIIICTPEYVFSIPSGLKNAIEWCVATTVFSDKPLGIITASAHGQKGHIELKLIMQTVMARFNDETTLLIPGIKGKINEQGELLDGKTKAAINSFIAAFRLLVNVPESL